MASWLSLTSEEIGQLWERRESFPLAWRRAATRQLLRAWLSVDPAAACAALIPASESRRIGWSWSTRFVTGELNFETRTLPRLVADFAAAWQKEHPERNSALLAALFPYADDEDEGWDNYTAALEFASLDPELLLRLTGDQPQPVALMISAISRIAERDPEKATRLAAYHDLDQACVFRGWAKTDPAAAIRAAREKLKPEARDNTEADLITSWIERSPNEAISFVMAGIRDGTLPESFRATALQRAADSLPDATPEAAWEWLKSMPGATEHGDLARASILNRMASGDPERTIALMAEGGAPDADLIKAVIQAKLRTATPQALLDWCKLQPETLRAPLEQHILERATENDPHLVLKQTRDDELIRSALSKLTKRDTEAGYLAWSNLPEEIRLKHAGRLSDLVLAAGQIETALKLASISINADPRNAPFWITELSWLRTSNSSASLYGVPLLDWLGTLPPKYSGPKLYQGAMMRWLAADSAAALAWHSAHSDSYPPDIRMALEIGIVSQMTKSDPMKAAAWAAAEIKDQTARQEVLKKSFADLQKSKPAFAAEALTRAGIPKEEQQRLFSN